MSFLGELKRRNVIRVAILYFVSSWLLLQLTDVLSSILPVPEWTGSVVFMMLVIGLAPALILSWVYEMTSEGIKREKDIDRSRSITSDTGRKINTTIVVLLVLAIAGMVADRLLPEAAAPENEELVVAAADEISRNSIAVLPFADLSAEGNQQFFTDGLSEELLNLLVRVDGLRVASRTSSFGYRGTTLKIPAIATELGVAHILEGSVRKSGDRIRITAQLIDAHTDTHLWSQKFDRKLDDIFAIQDEIGNAIVNALRDELGLSDASVTVDVATDNIDAYALYLVARELFTKRVNLPESIRLYQAAIALDPGFARAWEGLAAVEIVTNDWVFDDAVDHAPRAIEAANKALALDPDLSMPFAVLGSYAMNYQHDMIESIRNHDIALQNDPKNTSALLWQGISYQLLGLFDTAIERHEQCLAIDPGYLNCTHFLAFAFMQVGELDRAVEIYEPTLEQNFHSLSELFVPYYVRNGQRNFALLLADIKFGLNDAPVVEWIRALEFPDADHTEGLARLQQWESDTKSGIRLGDIPLVLLAFHAHEEFANTGWADYVWHPEAREFRTTTYFKDVIVKHGVLAYWQAKGFPDFCRAVGDDDFECDQPN